MKALLPLPLCLLAAACSGEPLAVAQAQAQDAGSGSAALLARHLVQVHPTGSGDRVPAEAIVDLAEERGERVTRQEVEAACAPDEGADVEAAWLRRQFACIMTAALKKRREWVAEKRAQGWSGAEDPVFKLAFYFNGGLNTQKSVLGTAWDSYRLAEQDGVFPVYMIWPTGGLSAYGEDLLHVRNGRWMEADDPVAMAGVPLRPVSDLLRGLAATPAAWGSSMVEYWRAEIGRGRAGYLMDGNEELLVRDGLVTASQNIWYDRTAGPDGTIAADAIGRDGGAGDALARAGAQAWAVAAAPVRAITTPGIGPGTAAWRNMVRRTRTAVRSIDEFPPELEKGTNGVAGECASLYTEAGPEDRGATLRRCYPRGTGAFARFFQWLESCATGEPVAPGAEGCPLPAPQREEALRVLPTDLRIIMIGHSMGAIVVNELLELFPDLPYETLVYMAGAASMRDTARAVSPVLERNRGCTRLYGLMLHPMNEAREASGARLLLSGSLLVYIDEFLETPKTLPDRTVGQWRNIRMGRHLFPAAARKWSLFRVYDREPAQGRPNPTTHGAFNDSGMPFWSERFWKPETVGFAPPEVQSCEDLFRSRLVPETTTAADAAWPELLERARHGETVRISDADGRPMARLVPPSPADLSRHPDRPAAPSP